MALNCVAVKGLTLSRTWCRNCENWNPINDNFSFRSLQSAGIITVNCTAPYSLQPRPRPLRQLTRLQYTPSCVDGRRQTVGLYHTVRTETITNYSPKRGLHIFHGRDLVFPSSLLLVCNNSSRIVSKNACILVCNRGLHLASLLEIQWPLEDHLTDSSRR